MMAHNLSAHALTSTLNHRSSPYLSQDHVPSRHIPVISVPEILEAFQQAHPSRTSDPWELPELKWLDAADNVTTSGSLPETSSAPEKFAPDGERWPFSALYGGDRVAVNTDDSLTQFSMQSMVAASPVSSGGSSVLLKTTRGLPSMNNLSNFVTRDYPTSSSGQVGEWRSHTPTGSSTGSHKRPAPSEQPNSDLSQERVNLNRSTFRLGGAAEKSLPERLASSGEVSGFTAIPYPPEKRTRQQQQASAVSTVAGRSRDCSSTVPDQKMSTEKGSMSITTNDQTVSPGRESKKPAVVVSDHEIHIWTERERRKKMNGMFSTLHSLLPHLTSKADKSTIVDEAINYIQSLEVTMKGLLKRKSESSNSSLLPSSLALLQASQKGSVGETENLSASMGFSGEVKPPVRTGTSSPTSGESHFQTLCSPNVVLNICGTDVFITICTARGKPGLLCRILYAMETHSLHVLNAHISTTDGTILYMIHAQITNSNQLANSDMLNITLQDLTNCLT